MCIRDSFSTVCIHGIVRDSQGRKMSKSLGNGIDPLEVIAQYGADAPVSYTHLEVLDCGKYAGMTTLEARKAILADLEAGGFLKEIEPLKHEVGTCYRCHSTIEPMVSKQWFVKMEPLAKPAIESVEKGEIKFVPERFTKNYMNWMKNTRDWCISRQLWWGHQIPAWYCDDCGETVVAKSAPCACLLYTSPAARRVFVFAGDFSF